MRWAHGFGRFARAMRLPIKQAGTRLARGRKDSITEIIRGGLTTIGHAALAVGKIVVKEALRRTNSDLATPRDWACAAGRVGREAEVGGSSYRVRTLNRGQCQKRYVPWDVLAIRF
ncbi:hypothetical protein FHR88_006291 [Bradyrhizobium betae]|nr:hypothetical protein [Bradyrhizobium betae]